MDEFPIPSQTAPIQPLPFLPPDEYAIKNSDGTITIRSYELPDLVTKHES